MDPVACLRRAWRALDDGDTVEAREALHDYRAWRARGGFEPPETENDSRGDVQADALQRTLDARPPEGWYAERATEDEDGGSVHRIWAYERPAVDAWLAREGRELAEALATLAEDLTGMRATHGGAGRWFWAAPTVEVTCGRVFVRQSGGLDV